MKVLSLFSGVGGFDMGLEASGMQTVFQCEWEKNCRSVLDRHWPEVPKWSDISTLTGKHILEHAPVIDVVAWGSPCQDLSLAGKREGLEGGRSGLFHEGIRIIKELREETHGLYPRISIWENVYGALSSNQGRDFETILDQMVEAGALLCEWRVLDAQYFGIPQRRRRVFVIAVFDSATANRCSDPLLPVSESVRWNSAASRTAKKGSADTPSASLGSESESLEPILINRGAFNQGTNSKYDPIISDAPVVPPLVSSGAHAVATHIGFSHTQGLDAQPSEIVFPTLRKEGNGHAVLTPMVVRRLTPIECERLMGWPDDHTLLKANGSVQADSNRFKQIGNGVASPVAQWIGEQIMQLHNTPKP